MPATDEGAHVAKLSLIVFSSDFAKVHYALAAAAAAAAIDIHATLFFTMEASRALTKNEGWHALTGSPADSDTALQARNVASFAELLESCHKLGVHFLVCSMGLTAIDLAEEALRDDLDIKISGLVAFLKDAHADGSVVFV